MFDENHNDIYRMHFGVWVTRDDFREIFDDWTMRQ